MEDTSAENARSLAREALSMLGQRRWDAASALAAVASVYARMASAMPEPKPAVLPGSRTPPAADSDVPDLLLKAHRSVEQAGGRMYCADLANALALDAQSLAAELSALFRRVGITRPGAGTLPVPGGASRPGYLADTLAAAIDAYRSLTAPAAPSL
ncbi:hypothetical protein GCM10009760_29790 [Kitasatospora kazusensis]|uniref:Uncharacterized protein n=1 Tax=Kitasatospora kazusensis TaxID=407974 RepID=A0ABN2ZJZ1_9ACTN